MRLWDAPCILYFVGWAKRSVPTGQDQILTISPKGSRGHASPCPPCGDRMSPIGSLARLLQLRGLVAIVPPRLRNAAGVAWRRVWVAEHVPVGDRVRGPVPVGYPVLPGAQQTVEGADRDHKFGARVGLDDLVDEAIDRRVGDAGKILRALGCRRGGREMGAQ